MSEKISKKLAYTIKKKINECTTYQLTGNSREGLLDLIDSFTEKPPEDELIKCCKCKKVMGTEADTLRLPLICDDCSTKEELTDYQCPLCEDKLDFHNNMHSYCDIRFIFNEVVCRNPECHFVLSGANPKKTAEYRYKELKTKADLLKMLDGGKA